MTFSLDAFGDVHDPISPRERAIQALVATYRPLWEDLNASFGGREALFAMAHTAPETFQSRFIEWLGQPVPTGQGLAGCGSAFRGSEARFYMAIWALHQTHGGEWTAFNNAMKTHPVGRKMRRYQRMALFAVRRLRAFAHLDDLGWTWAECRRSIGKGIEGSYRARTGFAFETAARTACAAVIAASGKNWKLESHELRIESENGEARLDIVAELDGRRIALACKSSAIDSSNHAALYERDVYDSLRRAGVDVSNAALVLGGPGWELVAQSTTLPVVLIEDITVPVEQMAVQMQAAIARLPFFAAPPAP